MSWCISEYISDSQKFNQSCLKVSLVLFTVKTVIMSSWTSSRMKLDFRWRTSFIHWIECMCTVRLVCSLSYHCCLSRTPWSFWPWVRRRVQDCSCSQGLRTSSLKWDLGKTDVYLFPFILPSFNPVKPDMSNNREQNLHFQNGIVSIDRE